MAGSGVATLAVSLVARSRGFKRGLRSAQRSMSQFVGRVASMVKRVGALSIAFTGLGSIVGGLSFAKASDTFAGLAKTASKLGIPIERLMALRDAADIAEVGAQKLDMGLQRMTRRVAEAAEGSGEAQNALRELGLSATALSRLRTDQVFSVVGDALLRVRGEANQVRLAFKLFDSEGVDLLETLKALKSDGGLKGVEAGIKAVVEANRDVGRSFDEFDAARVVQARSALTRFRQVIDAIVLRLGVLLAPLLTVVGERLGSLISESTTGFREWARSFDSVFDKFAWLEDKIRRASSLLQGLVDLFHRLARAVPNFLFGKERIDRAIDKVKEVVSGAFSAATGGAEERAPTTRGVQSSTRAAAASADEQAEETVRQQRRSARRERGPNRFQLDRALGAARRGRKEVERSVGPDGPTSQQSELLRSFNKQIRDINAARSPGGSSDNPITRRRLEQQERMERRRRERSAEEAEGGEGEGKEETFTQQMVDLLRDIDQKLGKGVGAVTS